MTACRRSDHSCGSIFLGPWTISTFVTFEPSAVCVRITFTPGGTLPVCSIRSKRRASSTARHFEQHRVSFAVGEDEVNEAGPIRDDETAVLCLVQKGQEPFLDL
jgi:hypothetical protein